MTNTTLEFDIAIVGGGLVGSAIGYGLVNKGFRVAMFDEGDRAFRASRGNFGLVWVQGKGWDFPAYSNWTVRAADFWPEFANQLHNTTGVDPQYSRPGGLEFCLSEQDWLELDEKLHKVQQHTNGEFSYQMLEHGALKKRIPQISDHVLGASFSPSDGHVNPLYLLRALHQGMNQAGLEYFPRQMVTEVTPGQSGFFIRTADMSVAAEKVVLCAGLGNEKLAKTVEINIPVQPNRGQLLITERVPQFLDYPTLQVRQTVEGGLQIGDSSESAGLNDDTSVNIMAILATRACRIFPFLEQVRMVRAWAALRVMTPDGKPVYQQSDGYPGAYGIACHSGVTLAAIHAGPVADWIAGDQPHELMASFSDKRFNLSN